MFSVLNMLHRPKGRQWSESSLNWVMSPLLGGRHLTHWTPVAGQGDFQPGDQRAHLQTPRSRGAGSSASAGPELFLMPPSLLPGHPAGVGVAFVSDLPKGAVGWGKPLALPLTASVRPRPC